MKRERRRLGKKAEASAERKAAERFIGIRETTTQGERRREEKA